MTDTPDDAKPDFDYWSKLDGMTTSQFAALTLSMEPSNDLERRVAVCRVARLFAYDDSAKIPIQKLLADADRKEIPVAKEFRELTERRNPSGRSAAATVPPTRDRHPPLEGKQPPRERKALLRLVRGLLELRYGDVTEANPPNAKVKKELDTTYVRLDPKTISKWVDQARKVSPSDRDE